MKAPSSATNQSRFGRVLTWVCQQLALAVRLERVPKPGRRSIDENKYTVVQMRPIWARDVAPSDGTTAEMAALATTELAVVSPLRGALLAAQANGLDIELVAPIVESAETDLCAGCDLARFGYFKQAYSLWRSWFEQTLFALYFLEAPLHRSAWRVVDEIDPGKLPAARLMLHQLLADSSEKHPFFIVYEDRFRSLFASIRFTPGKNDQPLKQAGHCLTDLSQGVHGTFNPRPIRTEADLPVALDRYALPVLKRAGAILSIFSFGFVHALIAPSEQQLTELRGPGFAPRDVDESTIVAMLPALERWLDAVRDNNPKGKSRG